MLSRTIRFTVCCLGVAAMLMACGDDGGDGDTSGGISGSVLGKQHDGNCDTTAEFADKCAEEGGLLGGGCQDAQCGGYSAMCYAPPPAPSANEFSCDGFMNCATGDVCVIVRPNIDGCGGERCDPFPAACEADRTCACLETNWGAGASSPTCTMDAAGNPTLRGSWL